MPWRNFINRKFETYTTTDMSQEKRAGLETEGWREATTLEFHIVNLCRGYDPKMVLRALQKLIESGSED